MDIPRHDFLIDDFRTESGGVLPQARIVYGTQGRLNAAGNNAVLLPSHYMARLDGYQWLVGPGQALDPERHFIITTELFGNGRSSSPSNTPAPLDGPRFPVTTIRDNVAAVHRLLTEALGVTRLRAVIGFSMGAQQAFQWGVSHPDFVDGIVATAGTAKSYDHGIVRLEGQIAAIAADAAFQGGEYREPPVAGLHAFAMVWIGWLFSQEWWRNGQWRSMAQPGDDLNTFVQRFARDFIPGADANDLILQMRTWQRHDVGGTPGFDGNVEAALRSLRMPVLYMPAQTDLYFPLEDARYEAGFIPDCRFVPIPSLWGHPAGAGLGPQDGPFLNREIGGFLSGLAAHD